MKESEKPETQSDAAASQDTGASDAGDKAVRRSPNPPEAPDADVHFASAETVEAARRAKTPWWERRREKIREEIERNRRGEYVVPTWALTLLLIGIIAAWAALIIFA